MAIPTIDQMQSPLLELLKDKTEHTYQETLHKLVAHFKPTKEELEQLIPTGTRRKFDTRVLWALSQLRHAGFLENTERGVFKITDLGLQALNQEPNMIDRKFLTEFSEKFREWQNKFQTIGRDVGKKKKEEKIILKPGIIVLLDALGTRGIWRKQNSDKISKEWNKFITEFEALVKKRLEKQKLNPIFRTFSDTIVIMIVTSEPKTALIELASCLHVPFITSMMIGMPLRGCITIGDFHHDKKLIIGPAIDEAAEYYTLPQWIGISASLSTNRKIEEIRKNEPDKIDQNFYKCTIPLKESVEQNAWALKWADISDEVILEDYMKLIHGKYDNTIQGMKEESEKADELSAALKWRNTLKFYELITQKK